MIIEEEAEKNAIGAWAVRSRSFFGGSTGELIGLVERQSYDLVDFSLPEEALLHG